MEINEKRIVFKKLVDACEPFYNGVDTFENAIDYVVLQAMGILKKHGVFFSKDSDVVDLQYYSQLMSLLNENMSNFEFYFSVQQQSGLTVEDLKMLENKLRFHCESRRTKEFDAVEDDFHDFFMWMIGQVIEDFEVEKDETTGVYQMKWLVRLNYESYMSTKPVILDNYSAELIAGANRVGDYLKQYVKDTSHKRTFVISGK